ncbi:MAG TPA: hypothetical protein VGL58_15440 [Caulobacteraceae bacterium]
MAWLQAFPGVTVAGERAEKAMAWPVGMASPLWAVFGAAASGGVAYWWMTQWTRTAVNIEAFAPFKPPMTLLKRIEILAEPEPLKLEPVIELAADVAAAAAEAVAEPAVALVETLVEIAPELALEAAPEPAPPAPAPVLETAPVAAPKAEPKAKAAKPPKVKAPPAPPDDLTVMTGIGPKLSEALAARGVTRFAQIAKWTEADLKDVDTALSLRGRAVREAWVAQAKRLAKR